MCYKEPKSIVVKDDTFRKEVPDISDEEYLTIRRTISSYVWSSYKRGEGKEGYHEVPFSPERATYEISFYPERATFGGAHRFRISCIFTDKDRGFFNYIGPWKLSYDSAIREAYGIILDFFKKE